MQLEQQAQVTLLQQIPHKVTPVQLILITHLHTEDQVVVELQLLVMQVLVETPEMVEQVLQIQF